jgi:hypothetical protein
MEHAEVNADRERASKVVKGIRMVALLNSLGKATGAVNDFTFAVRALLHGKEI